MKTLKITIALIAAIVLFGCGESEEEKRRSDQAVAALVDRLHPHQRRSY